MIFLLSISNYTFFRRDILHTSNPTILLFQEGYKLEVAMKPPPAVTNAVSWRSDGIK